MSYESLLDFQLGPIREWPGAMTVSRQRSPFSATFTQTKALLSRELYNLGAEAILVQLAMRDEDFRVDGLPRARAVAIHPGVMVSFNPDGNAAERMEFATDRFTHWEANLRAIALGLEALRQVDRYGITNGRQQYAGFRALPKGDDGRMGLYTREQAHEWLGLYLGRARLADDQLKGALREALERTHPDRTQRIEDADDFRRVMRVKELLEL